MDNQKNPKQQAAHEIRQLASPPSNDAFILKDANNEETDLDIISESGYWILRKRQKVNDPTQGLIVFQTEEKSYEDATLTFKLGGETLFAGIVKHGVVKWLVDLAALNLELPKTINIEPTTVTRNHILSISG